MLTASGWSKFLTQAGAGALDLEVLQSDLGKLAWRLHHGHVRSHFLQKIRPYELGFFHLGRLVYSKLGHALLCSNLVASFLPGLDGFVPAAYLVALTIGFLANF